MLNALRIAVLLSTLALPAGAFSQQLPKELAELARDLGCGPVPGFFDRPAMVEPPYLYGYLPGSKEDSAAFWCAREKDSAHLLVLVENGKVSSHFRWINFPGGLSLARDRDFSLSEFQYVDDPTARGPEGGGTKHPPLQSEYDGVITLF